MAAPLIPAALIPGGGQYIVAAADNNFTWVAQDQAGYRIEYRENIVGATTIDLGWVTSINSLHAFPAGTFVLGKEYVWRVKVRNALLEESSFSEWAVFRGGTPARIVITKPVTDLDPLTDLVYQHQIQDFREIPQRTLRYRLYTGATWNEIDALTLAEQEALTWDGLELYGGTMLDDSGVLTSPSTSYNQPVDPFLSGVYWYKIRCNIVNIADEPIESDLRTFYLDLTDLPQIPTITATGDNDLGAIVIQITNPPPDPGQPAAAYNVIYRSVDDVAYIKIADNVVGGIYHDLTCASGKLYYYKASAVGTSGVEGAKSASASGVIKLSGYVITDLDSGDSWILKAGAELRPVASERDRSEQVGIDETYPTITYGGRRFWRSGIQGHLIKDTGDDLPIKDQVEGARALLDAVSKKPLQLRTPIGDIFMIDAHNFQYAPVAQGTEGRAMIVSFDFVQVGD